MIKLTAKEFAEIVDGQLIDLAEDKVLNQIPIVNTDYAAPGTFFVAFIGEKVDGHDFVATKCQ